MKKVNLKLNQLTLRERKSPEYYKAEARGLLKKYQPIDGNFGVLVKEFVFLARDLIGVDVLREIISDLQRHVCLKLNEEERDADSEEMIPLRNKIKQKNRRGHAYY
ncbi:hypothetical protein GINT2_001821 [Glugoides intestinalis]